MVVIVTNVFQNSGKGVTKRCHQVHMKEHYQAPWSKNAKMPPKGESKSARAGSDVISHGLI